MLEPPAKQEDQRQQLSQIRDVIIEEIQVQLASSQNKQVRLSMHVDSLWKRFSLFESSITNGALTDITTRLSNIEQSVKKLQENCLPVSVKDEEKEKHVSEQAVLTVEARRDSMSNSDEKVGSTATGEEDSAEISTAGQDGLHIQGHGQNLQEQSLNGDNTLGDNTLGEIANEQEASTSEAKLDNGTDGAKYTKASTNETFFSISWRHIYRAATHVPSHMDVPNYYTVKPSVWDVTMFIGMPQIGLLGSFWIALVVAVNVVMQILLCGLINDYFTTRKVSTKTVDELRRWRWSSGHSWEIVRSLQVDRQSFQPLAQRICENDGSVPMSSGIAHVLALIAEYAPTPKDYDNLEPYFSSGLPYLPSVGMLMCQLAIIIWLLTVVTNFSDAWSFMLAILRLPAGDSSLNKTSDGIVWSSMSWCRKVLCTLVVALEMFVALTLCGAGVIYLCFTLTIGELLLNCAALKIVLDLDELLFNIIPDHAASILERMEPMTVSDGRHSWEGLNLRPVLIFIAIAILVVASKKQVLHPHYEVLIDAREQICGGNKDFLVVRDRAGVVFAAHTPVPEIHENTYSGLAVTELIGNPDAVFRGQEMNALGSFSLSSVPTGLTGAQWSMAGVADMPVGQITDAWNPRCVDMLSPREDVQPGVTQMFRLILEEELHVRKMSLTITDCTSLKLFCNDESSMGIRSRQVCPETCGCNHPFSTLVMITGDAGCPLYCVRSASYTAVESSLSCKDEAANGPMLSNWLQGVQAYRDTAPEDYWWDLNMLITRVSSKGCSTVADDADDMIYKWDDLCMISSNWLLRPLSFACPEACNCSKREMIGCPSACIE